MPYLFLDPLKCLRFRRDTIADRFSLFVDNVLFLNELLNPLFVFFDQPQKLLGSIRPSLLILYGHRDIVLSFLNKLTSQPFLIVDAIDLLYKG